MWNYRTTIAHWATFLVALCLREAARLLNYLRNSIWSLVVQNSEQLQHRLDLRREELVAHLVVFEAAGSGGLGVSSHESAPGNAACHPSKQSLAKCRQRGLVFLCQGHRERTKI